MATACFTTDDAELMTADTVYADGGYHVIG
jgi:hypothetical protein